MTEDFEEDGYGEGFDRTRLTVSRNISPRKILTIRTANKAVLPLCMKARIFYGENNDPFPQRF